MSKPPRRCLGCGELTTFGNRCETCDHGRYGYAEEQRGKRTVAAWVAQHGYHCPGYGRAPHPSHDLTADHVKRWAEHGDIGSPLTVLCRSCNSRRG